jgi:23S rRNA pseudouridine2604 synthase
MTRPTLKLPKPIDKAAASGPSTARGRQAQRDRHGKRPAQPAPPPAAAQPAQSSQPPKPAQPAPRTQRARPTPKSRPPQGARPPQKARPPQPEPRAQRPPRPAPPSASPEDAQDPRLSKRMSELGLCSRREADEWIENGWVSVDGKVVTQLGVRVPRDARIEVAAAASKHQSEQVTIVLHKPVGYVSGQPEDGYQSAVVLIKPENRWPEDASRIPFRPAHLRNLAPAGRLDIDSTGLIVYTQDGRVAKRLIGADSEVEKEYLVRVEGTIDEAGLARLRHGLELDGVKLKPAKVSWANEDQLRFVLREGRKRQIRRMCEAVGLVVTALKRVRTGGVPLGKLPVGQWRYLGRNEKF